MVLYRASEQFQCDAGVRSECAYAAHFHVHYASAPAFMNVHNIRPFVCYALYRWHRITRIICTWE